MSEPTPQDGRVSWRSSKLLCQQPIHVQQGSQWIPTTMTTSTGRNSSISHHLRAAKEILQNVTSDVVYVWSD